MVAPEDVKALRLTSLGKARADTIARVVTGAVVCGGGDHAGDRARAGCCSCWFNGKRELAAASAVVAGNSPVAVIKGPARAGKTTMLTAPNGLLR